MSDKWEVVGGAKKKPPSKSGVGNGSAGKPTAVVQPVLTGKKKKHKGPRDSKVAPVPDFGEDVDDFMNDPGSEGLQLAGESLGKKKTSGEPKKDAQAVQQKKPTQKKTQPTKEKEKPKDLVSALKTVPIESLGKFFQELKSAGAIGDVYLSWLKYSADALNSKLSHATVPDSSQWPNDLAFPATPKQVTAGIRQIISETVRSQESVDVMGLSFSNLLASMPTLLQRGDAGWGHLLFLREMCRLDPDLPLRRSKTVEELMESFGNKKEVGLCILWVAAQSALHSENMLKIVVKHLLPYYNFKHYKNFVVSVLATLSSSADMAGDNVIDPDEFEEFFEASFDPKKRRDFEKFYPRIKDLTLKNIRGKGSVLFFKFLSKLGDKDFSPVSLQGREVLEILQGCLENDAGCVDKWNEQLHKYPKESVVLLNYLTKNPESTSKFGSRLEKRFIQTDEFARAAVKTPDLVRVVKKLQVAFKKVEASKAKSKFSWRSLCLFILLAVLGLLWLDVAENGKGKFAKSNTGKLLEKYGYLDEALLFIATTTKLFWMGVNYLSELFRIVNAWLQPLLQSVGDQVRLYIPQALEYYKIVATYVVDSFSFILKFLQEKVFVDFLSPENLRKIAKETLAFIWTNLYFAGQKFVELVQRYIQL